MKTGVTFLKSFARLHRSQNHKQFGTIVTKINLAHDASEKRRPGQGLVSECA